MANTNLGFWKGFDRHFLESIWGDRELSKRMTEMETQYLPNCEVKEDDKGYQFKLDVPGLTKDQIKVELQEQVLTISGERREEKNNDAQKTHFSEVTYGSFVRSFTLPSAVDAERTEAKFDNGVLTVLIPKAAGTSARKVAVK